MRKNIPGIPVAAPTIFVLKSSFDAQAAERPSLRISPEPAALAGQFRPEQKTRRGLQKPARILQKIPTLARAGSPAA
jgi:hypothetical protein